MHIDPDRAPGSPHRRFNPLTGEWVLVSPQRTDRPWQGQVDAPTRNQLSPHDPSCYLCPGNRRSGGHRNPSYTGTYVFPNDFPALIPEGNGEYGICRVICYSPRHDLGFGELPLAALENVVETWTEQYAELGADPRIGHVQIFENRGQQMGASNPHPHGQIWATEHVPTIVAREQENLGRAPVLAEYVKSERDRIVVENEHFVAVVPYWATWPFETLVIARRQAASLTELKDHEREALSPVLESSSCVTTVCSRRRSRTRWVSTRPDVRRGRAGGSHLHFHFYPPSCDRRASASSWSDTSFSPNRSATSVRKKPPSGFER